MVLWNFDLLRKNYGTMAKNYGTIEKTMVLWKKLGYYTADYETLINYGKKL